MILLLDAGNTAIKWGVCRDGKLTMTNGFRHRDGDFRSAARAAWGELPAPASVHVANVGGEGLGRLIAEWTQRRWGISPVFIHATATAGAVVNAYANPASLGVDRWAALVGAWHQGVMPVCIVDCGSAITVDLLEKDGRHRGGLILPGIEMLKSVLVDSTANIQGAAPVPGVPLFARNTADAVTGGAVYLAAAALDRIIADMAAATGQVQDVLLSGGDAGRILPLLSVTARHDPDLVLKGLAALSGDS